MTCNKSERFWISVMCVGIAGIFLGIGMLVDKKREVERQHLNVPKYHVSIEVMLINGTTVKLSCPTNEGLHPNMIGCYIAKEQN